MRSSEDVNAPNTQDMVISAGVGPADEKKGPSIKFDSSLGQVYRLYEFVSVLSTTKACVLFSAKHRISGLPVCIKVRRNAPSPSTPASKTPSVSALRWEYDGLRSCDHPNVHKAFEFYEEGDCSAIVSELMDCDLFSVGMMAMRMSTACIRHICHQIVSGINHLHQRGICHMDIKPENILVRIPKGKNAAGKPYTIQDICDPVAVARFEFKVADMGFWAKCRDSAGNVRWLKGVCGSRGYTAPEVEVPGYNGAAADMWSLARTLFVFSIGFPPWEKANLKDPYFLVWRRGQLDTYWTAITKHCTSWEIPLSFKHMITSMLDLSPESRITTEDMLKHPFFAGDKGFKYQFSNEHWGRNARA